MTPEQYEYIIGLLVEELKKKTPTRSSNGQFIAVRDNKSEQLRRLAKDHLK